LQFSVQAADAGVQAKATEIVVGGRHACSLLDSGAVHCWGTGGFIGYAIAFNIGDDETPASAGDVDLGGVATAVATGHAHTCAVLDTGAVRCWGNADDGHLGYANTIGDDETPASAANVNVGGTVTRIDTGPNHTCAVLDTGGVRCWGDGNLGRLGYGNNDAVGANGTPSSAGNVNVGGTVTRISAGGDHTCALLSGGLVRCWGDGSDGRLGYANTITIGDTETPASQGSVDVGGTVTEVAVGGDHTRALLDTGAVRYWGSGADGRLGYANTFGDTETPASAGNVNVGGTVTRIDTGPNPHLCGARHRWRTLLGLWPLGSPRLRQH
jgi:hypothetical protein